MSDLYLIWNPVAGNGAASSAFQRVAAYLTQRQIPYASAMSEYPGHVKHLAAAAVEAGYRRVLVMGGDGTVREAAEALMRTEAALAIIPCGSGNDLVRALHIPSDVEAALEIALRGEPRAMDAAMANEELYFNIAGFGFDVDVLVATERYKTKHSNGSIAYLRGLLSCLLHLNLRKTTITWPGGSMERDVLILAVGNGTHFGGGMNITPGADPFDGLLNVCVIHGVTRRHVPSILPKFLSGKHIGSSHVDYFQTTELTAVCEPASRIEVDGEILPGTPVTFRILPKALRVIVPAQA